MVLRWRHRVNAYGVTSRAYLIGLLATVAPFVSGCLLPVLNLVVVAVLRDKLLFNPVVEQYVLTLINEDYYFKRLLLWSRSTPSCYAYVHVY